jgi:hypothetical protein
MREYESEEQFRAALEHPDLEVEVVRSAQLKFPVTDPLLRAAATVRVIRREDLPEMYLRLPRGSRRLRRSLALPIPGYRWVEAAGRKRIR